MGVDAKAQFETLMKCPVVHPTFESRFAKLKEVVQALSEHHLIKHVVRFEPPVPEATLVHGYLQGSADILEEAHARVQKTTGIRLWKKLRGVGYRADCASASGTAVSLNSSHKTRELYFEWNMGP